MTVADVVAVLVGDGFVEATTTAAATTTTATTPKSKATAKLKIKTLDGQEGESTLRFV